MLFCNVKENKNCKICKVWNYEKRKFTKDSQSLNDEPVRIKTESIHEKQYRSTINQLYKNS